jgi:hypothetical protein
VGIDNIAMMKQVNIDYQFRDSVYVTKNEGEKPAKIDITKGKYIIQYSLKDRDFKVFDNNFE